MTIRISCLGALMLFSPHSLVCSRLLPPPPPPTCLTSLTTWSPRLRGRWTLHRTLRLSTSTGIGPPQRVSSTLSVGTPTMPVEVEAVALSLVPLPWPPLSPTFSEEVPQQLPHSLQLRQRLGHQMLRQLPLI